MELTLDNNQSNISLNNITTVGYSGNDKFAAFIYSVILTIIGLVGNPHALIINIQRFRKEIKLGIGDMNPYVVFVLSLTIIDMFTSVVILPLESAEVAYRFTPYSDGMCKFFRYIQFVIHMSSVLHIVLISIHCWRQVCYPHSRQITSKLAIIFCIVFDVFAVSGAVLVIFHSGNKAKTINKETVEFCFVGENYEDPMFLRISMGILFIGFIVCLVIICACHTGLIVNRWRNRKVRPNNTISHDVTNLQKTTLILIILTVIFVIVYIPFMVLAIIKVLDKEFQNSLTGASAVAHGIFLRFPFLNNVINPFIYGLKDSNFRKKLLEMYPCLKSSKK